MLNDKIMDLFQTLFGKMWEWLLGPFKELRGFKELIYGKDGDTDLAYGIFTLDDITKIYTPGMNAFVAIAVTAILIGIIMSGMRISSSGINPSNRTLLIEFFKDLVIVGIVLFNLSTIYQIIFHVNYSIVSLFGGVDKELIDMKEKLDTDKGVLGELLIQLALLGLAIWANFYYMMRRLTLLLFMIMGPIMISLYLIPHTKGITVGWLKELIGTVMVQSVHAALYWMVALMAGSTSGLEGIILYIIFIPVSESIRSLLGLGGQMNDRLTKSAALLGGASLAGMYGSVRGALDGKSVPEALRNGVGKAAKVAGKGGSEGDEEGVKGLLSNAGTDIGSTSRAERMLKAGDILSKGGKAVMGAAGAVAGSPLGPMGSIAGSSLAFAAGGVVGGLAGRAAMAAAEGIGRRAVTGLKSAADKFKGINNAEGHADERVANAIAEDDTTRWAGANREEFMNDLKQRFPDAHESSLNKIWDNQVSAKRGEFLQNARNTVGAMKKVNGQYANASDLVSSTTNNLTEDWSKNNKAQFMANYDTNNPLPANASSDDLLQHNENKVSAWQTAVAEKRQAIGSIATTAAAKLGNNPTLDSSFINKEDFASAVGSEAGSVIGTGSREAVMAVKGATSSVMNASLYSGKSVNTPFLASQLATLRTSAGKEQYINEAIASGKSENEALKQWNQVESPTRFQHNISQIEGSMPMHIPLDNAIMGNKAIKAGGAVLGAASSFVTGTTGVKEIGNFIADTKIGQGAVGLATGLREGANFDMSQGVITGTVDGLGSMMKSAGATASSHFMNHVPTNVIENQAAFTKSVAFAGGIVGGVGGYKMGAKFGSQTLNPYNNAVNNQISEVSDIAHMAQTVTGPNGESVIAGGAVRMVTTANQSVLQVKDKTGQVQTVSRIASGDSSIKNGQTIYQDLTIQDGQLAPASNVYKEDSGGGRVALNRNINVNPNQMVGNRNTQKTPRVVPEVQSYNQKVDNGQYYLKDAMNEMSDIHMVVDRNRSYLVGSKDGNEYRISPYGSGDARLNTEEVIYRECEVRNRNLVTTTSHKNSRHSKAIEYQSSLEPSDLTAKFPPNKRNLNRKQNDRFRNKSFTESLR